MLLERSLVSNPHTLPRFLRQQTQGVGKDASQQAFQERDTAKEEEQETDVSDSDSMVALAEDSPESD